MSSVIFANFFENGNGLLTVDIERDKPNKDNQETMKIKLFRLLLTESGHYLLPTGEASRAKMPEGTKREVTAFFNKVATQATQLWKDVYPKMKHCFMASSRGAQTEGDRSESVGPPADRALQLNNVQEKKDDPPTHTSNINTSTAESPDGLRTDAKDKEIATHQGILPKDVQNERISHHDTKEFNKPCIDACDKGAQKTDSTAEQFHSFEDEFPKYSGDIFAAQHGPGEAEQEI